MRFWFDTEFIDDGKTIDLLSIGIVAQDGREYYAVSRDADWSKASDWVAKNVLPHLDHAGSKPRAQIRHEITRFLDQAQIRSDFEPPTEIWAYYGAYDWVAFCQLFGRMMDLPKGWPRYVRDVKHFCDDMGNPKLPKQEKGEHHALEDARWTRKAWEFLQELKLKGKADLVQ